MSTKTIKAGLSKANVNAIAGAIGTATLNRLIPQFSTSVAYSKGDYTNYNNTLYRFTADKAAGAWDSTKVETATLQDLVDDVNAGVASINGKANISDLVDGSLVVAKAQIAEQIENISDEVGSDQTEPFNLQATGTDDNTTETPTAPIAKHLELRGNSVAWNQLVNPSDISSQTKNDVVLTNNGNGSFTLNGTASADTTFTFSSGTWTTNHKYLITGLVNNGVSGSVYWYDNYYNRFASYQDFIYQPTNSAYIQRRIAIFIKNGTQVNFTFIPQVFDLTQLGKEYSSVLAFNRDYPLPHYEYNAGALKSCKSKKLVTVGYNQYDNSNPNDYIKVVAGQTYTLEGSGSVALYDGNKVALSDTFVSETQLPSNCHYVKISGGDSTTCFHLTWDESRTGYEPYNEHEYDLPEVELKSAGSVYDEITPDGTLTTRIGVETLSSDKAIGSTITISAIKSDTTNVVSKHGLLSEWGTISGTTITLTKTLSNGDEIYYEKASAITEQSDAYKFSENVIVDDFGTMEFIPSDDNLAPIPQGNHFFYPADYVLFIDDMYNRSKDGGSDADANNFVVQRELEFKELDSANIGAITSSEIVSGAFYRNNIAITSGLANAKYVSVKMSNNVIYPCFINAGTQLVVYSGSNWETGSLTVSKVYYKE